MSTSSSQKVLVLVILLHISLFLMMNTREITKPVQNIPNKKHVFVLAGQSNMAGRGGVDEKIWDGFIPQECYPNPAILRLSAELSWEAAYEPLHFDIDTNKTCGVGPGLVFANAVLQKDSKNFEAVGLVPCAVGGTRISEWCRGSKLYKNLVVRAGEAVKDGGVIQAILWYQGERDAITQEDADSYEFRLRQLIGDLRFDLQSPMLPFIQVALASAEGPFMDKVREAQLGMDLPNVISVDAMGLPLQRDGLHLSTIAQVQLGQMLADAFLNLKPQLN